MISGIDGDPFTNFITRFQQLGLENTAVRRFYAKYPGRVEEVKLDDRGLVRVSVGEIIKDRKISVYARPDTFAGNGYGLYLPPVKGDPVWVTFYNGDISQPFYSGGWWCAPSDAPNSAVSHVPTEFKNPGLPPSTRGLVVPAGHGWLFEEQAGRDQRFEVWTGFRDPVNPRTAIVKHHQFIMSDEPGQERVEVKTTNGSSIKVTDTPGDQKIEIQTPGGAQQINMNLLTGEITILTPGAVNITGASVAVAATAGNTTMTGAGNVDKTFQGSDNELVVGTSTKTVVGNEIKNNFGLFSQSVVGAFTLSVFGLSTFTFLGAAAMLVTGAFTIGGALATSAAITCGVATAGCVALGSQFGQKLRMLNEVFLSYYLDHTHPVVSAPGVTGAPTHASVIDKPTGLASRATFTTELTAKLSSQPFGADDVMTLFTEAD